MSFSKTSIFCLILLMAFIVAPAVMAHDNNVAAHSHGADGLQALTQAAEEDLNGE